MMEITTYDDAKPDGDHEAKKECCDMCFTKERAQGKEYCKDSTGHFATLCEKKRKIKIMKAKIIVKLAIASTIWLPD